MNIRIIAVGKLKEKYWRDAVAEYAKRLGAYCSIDRKLSSEQLSEKMAGLALEGKSNIVFVIGGSLGLSPEVSRRADFKLSFSDMTFPHQMMRVILLEQIYRSFKINRNETYHK